MLQVLAVAARLECLDLTGCDAVGDEVCGGLPTVRILNLSFVPITDSGLWRLAAGSPQLEALSLARRSNNLWGVGLYTDQGIAKLRRQLPRLNIKYTM
jgi:hypothetical protein